MIHRFRNLVPAMVWLVPILAPFKISAHPHSWIDLKTEVLGDDNAITGFSMDWTFDAMTTAYLFDGEDMSPAHRAKTLKDVGQSVINNMLSQHYFTYFYDKDTPIKYEEVKQARLTETKGKATLSFTLLLAHPYTYNGHKLTLRIFDPTYYVDMSWRNKSDITLANNLGSRCNFKLVEPHPTSAQISYAMSLPADADPDNQLGQLFTQTLELSCQAPN